MQKLNLLDVTALSASYGRGVVFYADKWTRQGHLIMAQLGITEGDIVVTPQETLASLTIPELTGPAAHEMDYTGENPKIDVPLYLTDPALIAVCSPSGSAHAGRSRRSAVKEWTLMVIPESVFLENDAQGIVHDFEVDWTTGGRWLFNGVPFTPEQDMALGVSFWLWRAVFNRPPRKFRGGAGDAKKNIEQVAIQAMHHPLMPEGQHIYTTGNPFDSGINLNGES